MQVVNDLETNLTTKLRSDPDAGGVIVELCRCLGSGTNYKTIVHSIRSELSKGGVGGSLEEKREKTLKKEEQCQEKKEKTEDEDVKGQTKWEENKEKVDRYHELVHKNETLRLEKDRLALQKDREMDQLKLALQNKEHELFEMQKALDKLQHQPIPEPRASAADLQVVKNLQDQLSLTQRQLEEAVEELTKARNTHKIDTIEIEELRAKLNEVTATNGKEIDRLNTEIYEFKAKNVTLLTELDEAKLKVHDLEINNRELRSVNQVRTFTQRHTAAFNLDSVMYELQRAKFPVGHWESLSGCLMTYLGTTLARDDTEHLHELIKSWVNSTKDSNPWITLVSAVDRTGEHDVAAELATTVFGVPLQAQLQDGVGGRTSVNQKKKRKNTPKRGEQCQEKEDKEEEEDVKRQIKWEENEEGVDRMDESDSSSEVDLSAIYEQFQRTHDAVKRSKSLLKKQAATRCSRKQQRQQQEEQEQQRQQQHTHDAVKQSKSLLKKQAATRRSRQQQRQQQEEQEQQRHQDQSHNQSPNTTHA